MKKVMIGILVLIPVIILVTVGAVTAFVTTRAYIAVEDIHFQFAEGEEKEIDVEFGEVYYDLSSMLEVVVLPEKATDNSFAWRIDDLVCYDDDYDAKYKAGDAEAPAFLVDENGNPVEENSTGRIKINSYCYFYVFVQAETLFDKCLVYVGGSEIKAVSVKGEGTLAEGETSMFEAVYSPIDSIVSELEWTSSNPAIADVDQNGVVTAFSAGTTQISVKAYGKSEITEDEVKTPVAVSENYAVTVTNGVSKFGESIAVHTSTVALSSIGITATSVLSDSLVNCTIDGDNLVIADSSSPASVTTNVGTATIKVVGENDIEILNAGIYGFDESKSNNFILALGELSLKLQAVYKSDLLGAPAVDSVEWSSSVNSVATVDSTGKVLPKSSGITTITATCGEKTASMKLAVEDKLTNLILDVTDASLQVGIARETVFASKKFLDVAAGTTEDNTFEVVFKRPTPVEGSEKAFYAAFTFDFKDVTDGTEKATTKISHTDNVLRFNSAEITDTTLIKVTISAKYPKYSHLAAYTQKTFTLKVINGVAVSNETELKKAAAMDINVALEDDVFVTNPGGLDNKQDIMIEGSFSLYGNGKTISSHSEQFRARDSMLFLIHGDNMVFSNVTIKVNENISEEISNADKEMEVLLGQGIRFEGRNQMLGEENDLDSFRLEYSIIENCRMCLNVLGCELVCEGNIMRNCLEMAIWAPTDINAWGRTGVRYFDLTMKNNVLSNLVGLSYSFTYSGYSKSSGENYYEQALAEGKNSKFSIVGFMDIYNWQELNVLSMVPTEGIGDDIGGASTVELINTALRGALESGREFADYRYSYNSVTYFHMGGMSTGILEPSMLNFARNDEKRLRGFNNTQFRGNTGTLGILGAMELITIWCYTNDVTDIVPTKTYTVNNKLINHLHGLDVEYPEGTPEYEAANVQ